MKLHVVGSSSSGNGYVLEGNTQSLFIEAGLPFLRMKRVIPKALEISGAIISHSHGDHAARISDYITHGVKAYALPETIRELAIDHPLLIPISSGTFHVGEFFISVIPMLHDVPCAGFIIEHPSVKGRILFATDTMNCPYRINDLRVMMLEANYSDEILNENTRNGIITKDRADRTRKTHMGIEAAVDAVRTNLEVSKLRSIILLHLSDSNSDADGFRSTMERTFGIPTYIADSGLTINI